MTKIERIPELDAKNARLLTDEIKKLVEVLWELVVAAYHGRAWVALGYESWDAYCDNEIQSTRLRLPREERAEVVASLKDSGLSIRAIAAATGASRNTVRCDLRGSQAAAGQTDPPQPDEKSAEKEKEKEFDNETDEEKQKARADFLAEAELQAIAAGGRIPTAEELKPKPTRLSVIADALGAEADCMEAVENFQKLAKQLRAEAKKIVDYGTIPDSRHCIGQVKDGMKNLQDTIWELTPLVPEESE